MAKRAKVLQLVEKASGIQDAINKLLKRPEVDKIVDAVVAARLLEKSEVVFCLRRVYHHLSLDAHGHDDLIVIDSACHGHNERAGLVALMMAQQARPEPMAWVEKRGQDDEKDTSPDGEKDTSPDSEKDTSPDSDKAMCPDDKKDTSPEH